MDKRKRNEVSDKKENKAKDKDRGELIKIIDKIIQKNDENIQEDRKIEYPDRGDSERKILTNQKPEKTRINIVVKKPTNEDAKAKNSNGTEKDIGHRRIIDNGQAKSHQELELRKRIRDKYTLKLKSPMNKSDHSHLINKKEDLSKLSTVKSEGCKPVDRPKKQLAEETTQTRDKQSAPSSARTEIPERKLDKSPTKAEKVLAKTERNSARRKPMIKTIMSKNGSVRIYKAVTFVDQKKQLTPLEIKIPGDAMKKQKVSKFTDTNSLKFKPKPSASRSSIKEKSAVRKKVERRRDRKVKHAPSPDRLKETMSPPTEVARWAPASIDQQTKPYYEAWVNTTLAAISKSSKKDRLFYERQRDLILSFQKAFEERPGTPELFYENFADEKYTGRIKITQR